MTLPILTDSTIQSAVEVLGPSGTAVSIATTFLLTIRFAAFALQVIMWFYHRRDANKEGRPSLPPPELPPSLGLVLLFITGSILAMTESAAKLAVARSSMPPIVVSEHHEDVASNGEAPPKKQSKDPPKKGCGAGCSGTYPNCRCTGQTEKQTKVSGIPTSILGNDCQPWSIEPLYTGPVNPPQS